MKAEKVLGVAAAGLACAAVSFLPLSSIFIWNRTESVPTGLYFVWTRPAYPVGTVVAYLPTSDESNLLEARRYTGRAWPLIKRVAATSGETVCRYGQDVYINNQWAGAALGSDAHGRPLPVWQGCRELGPQDVFLLGDDPRSADGRYFGVQSAGRIIGKAAQVRFGKSAPGATVTEPPLAASAPKPRFDPSDGG